MRRPRLSSVTNAAQHLNVDVLTVLENSWCADKWSKLWVKLAVSLKDLKGGAVTHKDGPYIFWILAQWTNVNRLFDGVDRSRRKLVQVVLGRVNVRVIIKSVLIMVNALQATRRVPVALISVPGQILVASPLVAG